MTNRILIFILRIPYKFGKFLCKTEKYIINLLLREKCELCGGEKEIYKIHHMSSETYIHCKNNTCKGSMYFERGVPVVFHAEFESSQSRTQSEGNIND